MDRRKDGRLRRLHDSNSVSRSVGVATSSAQPWIVPISLAVIIALFVIQVRGTEKVGALFGPVMLVWFITIAVAWIAHRPIIGGTLLAGALYYRWFAASYRSGRRDLVFVPSGSHPPLPWVT